MKKYLAILFMFTVTVFGQQSKNYTNITTARMYSPAGFAGAGVLKDSAGKLVSLTVYNANASTRWLMIADYAALPVDGPVTLAYPPVQLLTQTSFSVDFKNCPLYFKNGITLWADGVGTPFVKNSSSPSFVITGEVQ